MDKKLDVIIAELGFLIGFLVSRFVLEVIK